MRPGGRRRRRRGILIFSLNKLDVSLGDAISDDGVVVRIWWKPLILCIWDAP